MREIDNNNDSNKYTGVDLVDTVRLDYAYPLWT